jgi:hypothetical protein
MTSINGNAEMGIMMFPFVKSQQAGAGIFPQRDRVNPHEPTII